MFVVIHMIIIIIIIVLFLHFLLGHISFSFIPKCHYGVQHKVDGPYLMLSESLVLAKVLVPPDPYASYYYPRVQDLICTQLVITAWPSDLASVLALGNN